MVTSLAGLHGPFGGSYPLRVATPATSQTPASGPAGTADRVQISAAGQQQAATVAGEAGAAPTDTADASVPPQGALAELDPTARRALEALRQRDQEVRQHEQAHLLAAGPYAKGGPSYSYQTGPDGHHYAVGGEVPIDLSAVSGNPQATLQKALILRRAALAPTEPSATDQAVAAQATALAARAQQELLQTQARGRETAARAGQGAAAASSDPPSAATATAAAPHVCGSNCQTHDATPPLASGIAVALTPLASAARALEQYQVAAVVSTSVMVSSVRSIF